MARCASALYDIDLGKMCQLIRKNLRTLDISPGIGTAGYHLIDMFLRYVVPYERKRGMRIDDVVSNHSGRSNESGSKAKRIL